MNDLIHTLFIEILEKHTGNKEQLISSRPLAGGDINQAARMETGEGSWFAKWNDAHAYPAMFEAEAKGLQLLRDTGTLDVPQVVGFGEKDDTSMLVLYFMNEGRQQKDFWQEFGKGLALLHRHSAEQFGLDHDNYIGSLPQYNQRHDQWTEFFISCRLEPQLKMARDSGRGDRSLVKDFERLYPHLEDFFPVEKPSLVHGDLWSGNYMINSSGEACIIDPAVYYGHRLMDIGMSKLFGGFSPEFYAAYNNSWPLEKNWTQAVDIANLYPLMVHVNLFGGGYAGSVKSILRRF